MPAFYSVFNKANGYTYINQAAVQTSVGNESWKYSSLNQKCFSQYYTSDDSQMNHTAMEKHNWPKKRNNNEIPIMKYAHDWKPED